MVDTPRLTVSLKEYLDQQFGDIRRQQAEANVKMDKLNGTVDANHDDCVALKTWKGEHKETHARERGILGGISVALSIIAGAVGLSK